MEQIKLSFEINGAKIFPTNEQYEAVKQFAIKTIFGSTKTLVAPVNANNVVVRRRRRSRVNWTAEEVQLARNLLAEGITRRTVTAELNKQFGYKRTVGSVVQALVRRGIIKHRAENKTVNTAQQPIDIL